MTISQNRSRKRIFFISLKNLLDIDYTYEELEQSEKENIGFKDLNFSSFKVPMELLNPLKTAAELYNVYPEEYSPKIKFEKLFVGLVRDISQRIESEKQIAEALETARKANTAKSEFLCLEGTVQRIGHIARLHGRA